MARYKLISKIIKNLFKKNKENLMVDLYAIKNLQGH